MYEISKFLWSPLETESAFDHHQSRDRNRWIEMKILWKLLFRSSIGYCWMIDFDIQIHPGDLTNASKCKSNNSSKNQLDWFKIDLNASLHESKARNLKFKLWLLFPNAFNLYPFLHATHLTKVQRILYILDAEKMSTRSKNVF